MMQRIFTFLFFFMALTFCVAQAIPTDENTKDQPLAAGAGGDVKALDGTTFLGIDLTPLVHHLIVTLGISADGLEALIKVTIDLCNALLAALHLIGKLYIY